MATSNDAPANVDVSDEDNKLGAEYDKARQDRLGTVESKELGDNRKVEAGVVVTGADVLGTQTLYPGAVDRFDAAEEATNGGVALRASKGLATDDVTVEDRGWTAQSAGGYVADNAENVPGQTFTVDELPDPRVMAVSGLPAHAIPAGLVVDSAVTDSISPAQERGADLGTSIRRGDSGEPLKARPSAERKVTNRGDSPA